MEFYQKHVFFCTNQKDNGRKCCQSAGASELSLYAKAQIKAKGMHGAGAVRVSDSGCLGRCKAGPNIVIYPEGVWYTYSDKNDIDEIIQEHIFNNRVVDRLLVSKEPVA